MWLLRKLTENATIQYIISEKKCYTLGRKNSDIVLDDCSISRNHCIICIASKKDCPFTVETETGVWLIDKKSKYGTYIYKNYKWTRLYEEQVEQLSKGSLVRFGLMQNIWRLEYTPLIACTSKLSVGQVQEVKAQLTAVDGKLMSKWTSICTVVIVNDVTLTMKNLLALIHGVPIVTRKYLDEVIENVKKNQPLPDCKKFKPEIAESTLIPHLVSLNPDDNRRELFKGKTFIIPREEQFDDLKDIIESAGGCAELLRLDENWRKLADENTIVVHLPYDKIINPDQSAQAFKNMTTVLKNEYGVRVIPEIEIYQAIAYSSIEKYCNPKSQIFELRLSSHDQNSCGEIIQEETPSESQDSGNIQQSTKTSGVKELDRLSYSVSEVNTSSKKRNHSPEIEKNSKRAALVIPVNNTNSNHSSDDIGWFCKSLNYEQVTPIEVAKKNGISKAVENLKLKKLDSVEVEQGVADDINKQSCPITVDCELDDFWDNISEEYSTVQNTKRKLSLDFTKENNFDPPEKKKCTDIGNCPLKNADSVAEKLINIPDEPGFSNSPTHTKKSRSKETKYVIMEENGKGYKWYRLKNVPRCKTETEVAVLVAPQSRKCKEAETEKSIPEKIILSREREEEISRMLLEQGWRRLRRRRTSDNS